MRILLAVAAAVLVAVLGAVQLASSAAYGDLGERPSLPRALHAGDPALLRPFLGGRSARAAAALHDGDVAAARALIATLPADTQSADLRGQLAQAAGQPAAAVDAFVAARDVVRAQRLIDDFAASDPVRALDAQRRLVGGLSGDPGASEDTANAWWRLGQLQAAVGYREPARRRAMWDDARASYAHALAIAPNEETYLLADGYQALANGDAAGGERRYRRAAEVVTDSADAYGGLALAAAMRGDCVAARAAHARFAALAPAGMRDPADDPLLGPALRRCS